MNKLPDHIQTLLSASNQINNHHKAVEELVYNALDAGSTSIAIRINIQDNTIQIIDNGCGVCGKDFNYIGQKYMTSKFVDLSTLKSMPNKYGFRGQSLANIIHISKNVKVTSRHEKSEETWIKIFEFGKEKHLQICNTRPSKGTTVEVNGFLYNVKIQKKSRDILNELQNIKTYLEHLSLVHSNISLSLRDDTKNEIIFKMHRNRDIHQTLSTLYNIKKEDFQELQVEKNEYKVTAFIGKGLKTDRHVIFLNGKFISNSSKLHKIVNNNLCRYLQLRNTKKTKAKNFVEDQESHTFQNKLPFYFIFIRCPYMDYDLSISSNQSVEFTDWDHIKKLLDKLIKFFTGDMNLKEVKKIKNNRKFDKTECSDTREQVKKIIEKILGNHPKKSGNTIMNKGIKGKQIKRKDKKLIHKSKAKLSHKDNLNGNINNSHHTIKQIYDIAEDCLDSEDNSRDNGHESRRKRSINKIDKIASKKCSKYNYIKPCLGARIGKTYNTKFNKILNNKLLLPEGTIGELGTVTKQNAKKDNKTNKFGMEIKSVKKRYNELDQTTIFEETIAKPGIAKNTKESKKNSRINNNKILRKFKMETESVKKRCNKLDQATSEMLKKFRDIKCDVYVNGNVQYSNITENNRNNSICNQTDEIVIRDYISKLPKVHMPKIVHNNNRNNVIQSNYNLVQTILKSQPVDSYKQRQTTDEPKNSVSILNQSQPNANTSCKSHQLADIASVYGSTEPVITFQSHNYNAYENMLNYHYNNHTYRLNLQMNDENRQNFDKRSRTFITKQSRDNFLSNYSNKHIIRKNNKSYTGHSKQFKSTLKRLFKQTSKLREMKNQILGSTSESIFTIEYTKSNYNKESSEDKNYVRYNSDSHYSSSDMKSWTQYFNHNFFSSNQNDLISINTNTYTLPNVANNNRSINEENWTNFCTYTIENTNENISKNIRLEDINFDNNQLNNSNLICFSKSQEKHFTEESLDPINVCETILHTTQEILHEEFELSFNNGQKYENRQDREYNKDNHEEKVYSEDILDDVSQYFTLAENNIAVNTSNNLNQFKNYSPITSSSLKTQHKNTNLRKLILQNDENNMSPKEGNPDCFIFRNRMSFIPKGMSPIFENRQTKTTREYDISEDYYKDDMYNNFAKNVQNQADIFEPKIQEARELTTKNIDKVNVKLNKDNASLKFNGQSLNGAKVLGQIDEKFIAAIIKEEVTDFLVLFDQHAVHERITLEKNLSDYFNGIQWKSVQIDDITLKMSEDDILYLHNYMDKFLQLGLQWTVLSTNKVSITNIPAAIIGKNTRQVEKIIQSIKNMITEEINVIKIQGGCVSLYPKSIMDLVFSEACRYAIKFGDKLSKSDCVELLKKLSNCKTPFQCAHGRPVMAVIMDMKQKKHYYKINHNKLMEWKRK